LLGGTLVGLVGGLLTGHGLATAMIAGGIGGLLGSLADSLLGATVQRIYYSDVRGKETEKRFEKDGTRNRALRGWAWMNNDMVNMIASLAGGAVAVLMWQLLR
jgi:uncharacterized membrane protein